MADNAPLGPLLKKYIIRDMLKQIAREHENGCVLLIASTNLDSRQAVIWDITKLDAAKHPRALTLMRKIMLASAAIPGSVPRS